MPHRRVAFFSGLLGDLGRAWMDSGLVDGADRFLRIDILVSINQSECWDSVLNILATPIDVAVR